jgi:tetratricopeptide (TPR) repeat protein
MSVKKKSHLGQYDMQTIDSLKQAIDDAENDGNQYSKSRYLGELGVAYYSSGLYEEAKTYLQQAIAISHEINDSIGEGSHLGNLGNISISLGNYRKAIEYYEQTLLIAQAIDGTVGEQMQGLTLANIGNAYLKLRDYRIAIEYYERAKEIFVQGVYLPGGYFPRVKEHIVQTLAELKEKL